MTFWPAADSTKLTNCCASACTWGEFLAERPITDGRSVAGLRYSKPMFLSVNEAPMAADDCTRARLIRPLASACRVGPLVGLMTRPFDLSVEKNCSPAETLPRVFITPAISGKVGPDWDGSFMPTWP